MADGGASSFIMLVTALLISGSVSTILISEWAKVARAVENEERKSSGALGVSAPASSGPRDPAPVPNLCPAERDAVLRGERLGEKYQ